MPRASDSGKQIGTMAGRGARNLPLVGGAVGGFLEVCSARVVGRQTQRIFLAPAAP